MQTPNSPLSDVFNFNMILIVKIKMGLKNRFICDRETVGGIRVSDSWRGRTTHRIGVPKRALQNRGGRVYGYLSICVGTERQLKVQECFQRETPNSWNLMWWDFHFHFLGNLILDGLLSPVNLICASMLWVATKIPSNWNFKNGKLKFKL